MKLLNAARFSGVVFLVALLYTLFVLNTPLSLQSDWSVRRGWLAANGAGWMLGGWLALLAIFAWMVLLVALAYTYLPGHRIPTMLESGLMVISALLMIAGTIVWMNLLPQAGDGEWAGFVDGLALTFLGAGFFMGGATTTWIALDLGSLGKLPWSWLIPGILSGLLALPSPFVLPNPILLVPSVALFFVWCVLIGVRREVPAAYPELTSDLIQRSIRKR